MMNAFGKICSAIGVGAIGFWTASQYKQSKISKAVVASGENEIKGQCSRDLVVSGIFANDLNQITQSVEGMGIAYIAENIGKYGYPSHENVHVKNDFVLSYNPEKKIANWVLELLHKSKGDVSRKKTEFMPDPTIIENFSASVTDYRNTGYDKGHLAAACNHTISPKAYYETFHFSNVAPQIREFNSGIWQSLEKHVLAKTKDYEDVYVCTGPLFIPDKVSEGKWLLKYEVIGPNNVAVPTHFFKVILGITKNKEYDIESYMMKNEVTTDKQISKCLVAKSDIEKKSGLLIFREISEDEYRKINGKMKRRSRGA